MRSLVRKNVLPQAAVTASSASAATSEVRRAVAVVMGAAS